MRSPVSSNKTIFVIRRSSTAPFGPIFNPIFQTKPLALLYDPQLLPLGICFVLYQRLRSKLTHETPCSNNSKIHFRCVGHFPIHVCINQVKQLFVVIVGTLSTPSLIYLRVQTLYTRHIT